MVFETDEDVIQEAVETLTLERIVKGKMVECKICGVKEDREEMFESNCGDWFCFDCWESRN